MISVVIATYNGERYIEQQLASIIGQSLIPDEIILVDDNSIDETLIIAENILKNSDISYEIIKHEDNKGVCDTFWNGIGKANGDVVFLSDQDDCWFNNKIEIMSQKISEGYDIVMSNAKLVNDDFSEMKGDLWRALDFYPIESRKSLLREMLKRNYFTGMNMCFKKRIIYINNRPRNMLHDEFIGWVGLLKGKVGFVHKELSFYRQHENNVVGVGKKRRFCGFRKTKEIIRKSIKKEIKKLLYINNLLVQSNNDCLEIDNAIRFYCGRYIYTRYMHVCDIYSILIAIYKGGYRKYTSKNEDAVLKDLFCKITM